jgi:hypothetical protein
MNKVVVFVALLLALIAAVVCIDANVEREAITAVQKNFGAQKGLHVVKYSINGNQHVVVLASGQNTYTVRIISQLELLSVVKGGRDNYEEEELSETMIDKIPELCNRCRYSCNERYDSKVYKGLYLACVDKCSSKHNNACSQRVQY